MLLLLVRATKSKLNDADIYNDDRALDLAEKPVSFDEKMAIFIQLPTNKYIFLWNVIIATMVEISIF